MNKNIIITTILIIIIYVTTVFCKSYVFNPTQSETKVETVCLPVDTLNPATSVSTTTTTTTTIDVIVNTDSSDKETVKKRAVFRKEIKPIEIDTTWKSERDSNYVQLKKIGMDLKEQQKKIDSMLVVRKK